MNCLHSVNQGNESVSGSQLLTCPVPERSGKAAEWEISSVFIVPLKLYEDLLQFLSVWE